MTSAVYFGTEIVAGCTGSSPLSYPAITYTSQTNETMYTREP